MPLDPSNPADLQLIDAIVRRTIAAVRCESEAVTPLPRLTVEQFACAVELSKAVVLRKIRVREIPPDMVFGDRGKRIASKALGLFGVTPQEARARLEAYNLWPACEPSPALSSDTASRPPQ